MDPFTAHDGGCPSRHNGIALRARPDNPRGDSGPGYLPRKYAAPTGAGSADRTESATIIAAVSAAAATRVLRRGSQATSHARRSPDCLERLARQPELAPLALKVYLGHADVDSMALFDTQSVPTASERPLLLKWSAGRRNCLLEAKRIGYPRGWSAAAIRADNLAGQIVIDMIAQLADGKITYGQFNRQRNRNAVAAAQVQ